MSFTYRRAPRSLFRVATTLALACWAIFAAVAIRAEQRRLVTVGRRSPMRSPLKTPSTGPRTRIAVCTTYAALEQASALLEARIRPYSALDFSRSHDLAFVNEAAYARRAGFEPPLPAPSISRPRSQDELSSAGRPNFFRQASSPRWPTCA
jgi:hypothetical protein